MVGWATTEWLLAVLSQLFKYGELTTAKWLSGCSYLCVENTAAFGAGIGYPSVAFSQAARSQHATKLWLLLTARLL